MVFFESIESILLSFGYIAVFLIVFAESGLFFGFFLPGDSLLFTAGLLAQKGFFNLHILLAGTIICAVLGDQVGYWMGSKYGRGFFSKPKDFFRDPKHIQKAEGFYKKHGKLAIVAARFFPVVRTFAPIVAGIAKMEYKNFLFYNIIGGVLWSSSFILLGFFIGSIIPNASEYITAIIAVIIIISLIPAAYAYFSHKK